MKLQMTREELICQALDEAIARGISICPGAAFSWSKDNEKPLACNFLGALDLKLGRIRDEPDGFTKKVCKYLKIGTYWLYRFHQGFDYGRQLTYKVPDKKNKNKLVDKEDEVSKLGIKLRKKYYESLAG